MNERIKEIIAFLMDPEADIPHDPSAIESELENMGYSRDEINQAMNMLDFESSLIDSGMAPGFDPGTRILGESEKFVLSTSAQGYLLKLYKLGWVSEMQLTNIIENSAMEFSPPVSINAIKEITSRFVSDLPDDISSDTSRRDGRVH